jgi:hypothetical protein
MVARAAAAALQALARAETVALAAAVAQVRQWLAAVRGCLEDRAGRV